MGQNLDFLRGDSALDQSGAFPAVSGSNKGSAVGAGSSKKMPPVLATARPLGESGSSIKIGSVPNDGLAGAFHPNPGGSDQTALDTVAKIRMQKKATTMYVWYAMGGGLALIVLLAVLVAIIKK